MSSEKQEKMVRQMEEKHVHSENCSHNHEEETGVTPDSYQGIAKKTLATKDEKRKARNRQKAEKRKAGKARPPAARSTRRRALLRKFVALSKRVAVAQKRLEKSKEDASVSPTRLYHHQFLLNRRMAQYSEILTLMKKDNDNQNVQK